MVTPTIKRGSAELAILSVLAEETLHGYELAKRIEEHSGGVLKFNLASLYPMLYRLEKRGWIQSEWGVSENNRKAKFYQLTAKGRKHLVAATSRWRTMTRAIGLILGEPVE